MLKGVPKLLSPELIKVLAEMGHGDEIVIGDANFPHESCGQRVVRADGISGSDLLAAILKVIPLDEVANDNFVFMDVAPGMDEPEIWSSYRSIANEADPNVKENHIERFDFYDRSKKAFAIVASGEERTYANIILKKGVIQ